MQVGLLKEVLKKLDNYETSASFEPYDKVQDAKIKKAIKLWLETWIAAPISIVLSLEDKTISPIDRDYWTRRYGR